PRLLFQLLPSPPRSPLFPYTTLFRSSWAWPSWRATRPRGARRVSTPWPRCATSDGSLELSVVLASPHPPKVATESARILIADDRSEEHTSELQSLTNLVCRLLLEKKK